MQCHAMGLGLNDYSPVFDPIRLSWISIPLLRLTTISDLPSQHLESPPTQMTSTWRRVVGFIGLGSKSFHFLFGFTAT